MQDIKPLNYAWDGVFDNEDLEESEMGEARAVVGELGRWIAVRRARPRLEATSHLKNLLEMRQICCGQRQNTCSSEWYID